MGRRVTSAFNTIFHCRRDKKKGEERRVADLLYWPEPERRFFPEGEKRKKKKRE